jgi:SAM-dependent methyltransferase
MSSHSYIHGTAASEQMRLAALNRLTNGPFIKFLGIRPGMQVLEVGSGLGILAAEVAAAADGVQVLGVERSPEQLASAVMASGVRFISGDAHALELDDASFDLVYCRYLLEHVNRPEQVLAEMRRVARPGGRVAAMENDISLVRIDPPCPAFAVIWKTFAVYQEQLGGDGYVGRRLFRLFRQAGFRDIELSVQPEVHWSGSPQFAAWLENLIGNVESARRGLIECRLTTSEQIDRAAGELRRLAEHDQGSAWFMWNRAMAVK